MIKVANSTKARIRFIEGRQARLRAEVFHRVQDLPINYSCVYLRIDQAKQFRSGWDSVSAVDIDVAVKKVKTGKAKLLPETARKLKVQPQQRNCHV